MSGGEARREDYEAPSSSSIAERQNDDRALQLLIAQRRLYNRAKRWQSIRWVGLLILAVAAPFVSVLVSSAAVIVGAVAGLWLFVGRVLVTWAESRIMTKAAAVQEELDFYIFAMPRSIERSALPTLEDVAALIGPNDKLRDVAKREKLIDWYPVTLTNPGNVTVALAQRANAAYTDRLIRTTVIVWAIVFFFWLGALVVWSVLAGMSLEAFLLGVLLPVLPAMLDVFEYLRSTWRASRDRKDLADTIQRRRREGEVPIDGQELLVWQDRMYDLRRTTPQLPNWLYGLTRKRNEAAMHSAAKQLGGSG